MFRAVLICFLTTACVNTEMRSSQHSVYVSRKSRSNSLPLEAGYVYSKVDQHPGTLAMYGDTEYNPYAHGRSGDFPISGATQYDSSLLANRLDSMAVHMEVTTPFTSIPDANYDMEYEKSKTEAKYDSHFYPSKMESDAMYEKLKSVMHYKYPENAIGEVNYDIHDYHIDDDDVRSSSRSSYEGWPYLYHSPYEYEFMKIDSDVPKAKDKRYANGITKDVIPVHEHVDDTPSDHSAPLLPSKNDRVKTTDNPIFGNQPFFSFVLNDYFDKSADDDHLSFKGLGVDWGKEFDHESSDPYNYLKRDRRVEAPYTTEKEDYFNGKTSNYDTSKAASGESSTEKAYNNKHAFEKHEQGDGRKENHKSDYAKNGNNYTGFKNFIDSFANKFGGEEHKKDSNYILKQNQDKGENRKGFRRVYHKDEYQEDNEFYDNTNNTANAVEKGSSALHNGGSEALLQSNAVAAVGNEANSFNKAGNAENNNFEKNNIGYNNNKGYNNDFNRYRDVAKSAARSNSADYVDHQYRP